MVCNKERVLVEIVKEICDEYNIGFESFSYDWILKLEHKNKVKFINGYIFDLNSAATNGILKDKAATTDILKNSNVPCVNNLFFMKPSMSGYIGVEGNWKKILKYAKKYNYNLVCKPNKGTGGNCVFKVKNQLELESALEKLFSNYRDIVISPFYNIENEYRVIILKNQIQLIYKKENLQVIGDGKTTLRNLIKSKYPLMVFEKCIREMDFDTYIRLEEVIPDKEVVKIVWQFNLGKGSLPNNNISKNVYNELTDLALSVSNALDIQFASIDIIKCNDGFKVLEANGGVMMEYYSKYSDENYKTAKEVYRKAILAMFDEK